MTTPGKPLRLFFAVPVGEAVKEAAAREGERLRAAGVRARWLEPETLHLTLRFLGSMPEERLPALERSLEAAVAQRAPFDLRFDRLGTFGDRVLWAGVGEGAAPLEALAEALAAALEKEGVPREERPFRAHLTLGRPERRVPAAALGPLDWSCRAEQVVLYESRLSPKGAEHRALRSAAMRGPRSGRA